jgi:hypothetical protein
MRRTHRAVPLVPSVIAAIAVVLLLYLAGYFALGDAWWPGPTMPGPRLRMRVFGSQWIAAAYRPAAWVESRLRGYEVIAGTEEDLFNASP